MRSRARTFSHLYVERGAFGHPRTQSIIARFPGSSVVTIDDYQNVFGRGRQDFWRQKASPKLVLANKKDNFLYPGNALLQGSQSPNFYYNALVLNCPYDCHYCYLQGMYAGANVVAFVNLEDYFDATEKACRERAATTEPLNLAISYDTDLLALEAKLGYVAEWIGWARSRDDILIEVRTKSAARQLFKSIRPASQVRISWTLSPEDICRRYESGTPGLEQRLATLNHAAQAGWRIAICIDPILQLPGSGELYGEFVTRIGDALPWEAIERVELGVFRVGSTFFKRMLKRPDTDLLHYPYEHGRNTVSYNKKEREQLVDGVLRPLSKFISREKIYIWT